MIQSLLTIGLVAGCGFWLAGRFVRAYFSRQKSGCGGSCNCGHGDAEAKAVPKAQQVMIRSEDLVARLHVKR